MLIEREKMKIKKSILKNAILKILKENRHYNQKIKNAELEIEMVKKGRSVETFKVTLLKGEWPKEEELIKGIGGTFGGDIKGKLTPNNKIVMIDTYID